jgi:hypothetical protein
MGLFSFATSLFGGNSAKKASRRAEAAQLGYLDKALGEERRQFDLTRQDYAPYLAAGTDALGDQGDLIGLNGPEAQQAAIARLTASPLYQSLYRTGEEAVLQNASATGGLRGGNTQRGLADFGADTLAQVIERQLASLGGISGRGQQAVDSSAAVGANLTNAIAQILGQQGQVRAGGLLTRGGISSGMWNNAGSFLDSFNPTKLLGLGF